MTDLSREALEAALEGCRYGHHVTRLETTTSTMDEARRAADAGAPDGLVIVAEEQTAGRGSRGREWASPAGLDLYCSIVARPRLSLRERPPLTLAVGLSVAAAVAETTGLRPEVKWPNDVWIDGRKCAGVLVESTVGAGHDDAIVVGIGVNVNRTRFPRALREKAISLRQASGRTWDRGQLLVALLKALAPRVAWLEEGKRTRVLQELEQRLALRGRPVRCGDEHGVLVGVDDDGALLLRREGRMLRCLTGPLEAAPEPPTT